MISYKKSKEKNLSSIVMSVLIFLTVCLSGCVGLLTESQVAEIKKFSAASGAYSEYPGAVIHTHAQLSLNNQLANASSSVDGQNAFGLIEKGMKKYKKLTDLEKRADTACRILRSYSGILEKLSSDSYSEDTQADIEKLGIQLDRSVSDYNKLSGKSFDLFGGSVAAILKGAGSVYIKTRQHKAIKQAVTDADPVIGEITTSIIKLLDTYAGKNSLEILKAERDDLQTWYETAGYKQPVSTAIWMESVLETIDSVIVLVDRSKTAAEKLKEAHKVLLTRIDKKMDLKETVKVIETLADEVEAAKDLKDKIETHTASWRTK